MRKCKGIRLVGVDTYAFLLTLFLFFENIYAYIVFRNAIFCIVQGGDSVLHYV